jgi:hypothetical protein
MAALCQRSVHLFLAAPLLLGLALAAWPLPCRSQEGNEDSRVEPSEDKPEATRRLKLLARRAAKVHPWSRPEVEQLSLEGFPEPLFRLVDPTRDYPDGTVWAWPNKGRPAVVLTLSIMANQQPPRWLYEFASLSDHPVGSLLAQNRWSCSRPGWEAHELANAPVPASSPRERLRQIRELARRFTAVELLPPPTRFELRLLPQPILRYSDEEAGQLDGAIFVFCHGTNPEILLVLEAAQKPEQSPTWQFGFARNTIAELRVELDAKEVWKQPYISFADAGSSEPYFIAVEPFDASELEQIVGEAQR